MRIRKRRVPLPFSLLSPIPLTDPLLFTRHHSPPTRHLPPTATSSSDLILNPPFSSEGLPKTNNHNHANDDDHDDDPRKEDVVIKNSDAANEGRWSEGERVMPLKKRRPSSSFLDNKDHDDTEEVIKITTNINKQKRGTTIMEGSRCSRVNGRGWRCCQPTLVGYSLCEHHLGKGRLRSVNTATVARGARRKKQVVGVVKARSLSSLLGQTTTPSTTTTSDNNNVDGEIKSI